MLIQQNVRWHALKRIAFNGFPKNISDPFEMDRKLTNLQRMPVTSPVTISLSSSAQCSAVCPPRKQSYVRPCTLPGIDADKSRCRLFKPILAYRTGRARPRPRVVRSGRGLYDRAIVRLSSFQPSVACSRRCHRRRRHSCTLSSFIVSPLPTAQHQTTSAKRRRRIRKERERARDDDNLQVKITRRSPRADG